MKKKIKYLFILLCALFINMKPIYAIERECIACGESEALPAALPAFSRNALTFVQVLVPVIIIVAGIIVLIKAVVNGDEKEQAKAKTSLIRKVIAGVMILLVVTIVKFVFTILGGDIESSLGCVACFTSDENSCNVVACPDRDENYTSNDNTDESSSADWLGTSF